jgi:glycosyltransferase involved in cell wall biosynthesis
MKMKCNICKSTSNLFSQYAILGKHSIKYYQCTECGFVQTESPYWLEEAYSDAIADSDIGLVYRNLNLSVLTSGIISNHFNSDASFLDYGGGYGLFVRLMRDNGFDFYWEDKFCQNIFAKDFTLQPGVKYELLTAFEVFEHLSEPLIEIEKMLQFSDSILFSTELLPASNPRPGEWWCYAPQTGQHISFYSHESLQKLAACLGINYYSDGKSNHLLSVKEFPQNIFSLLPQKAPRQSLLSQDATKLLTVTPAESKATTTPETNTITQNESEKIIVVDGVFFQLYKTGIARVWESLIREWTNTALARGIILLDRAGTAPQIPGIKYRTIPAFDLNNLEADRQMLQQVCNEENADVFTSTYYTTPLTTPSLLVIYDMIPEVLGWDMKHPHWQAKIRAIDYASSYIAISENSASDLLHFYPNVSASQVTFAHCGVSNKFSLATPIEIQGFRCKYGIRKPYFLITGGHEGYKNTILFFRAFSLLANKEEFDIFCTSPMPEEYRVFSQGSTVHHVRLSDDELRLAYAGAVALVYPSKYEGFGMPIIEALACGCPTITCPQSSIPEVAGDAVIYVQDEDVHGMLDALCQIQQPSVRQTLINRGLTQAQKFSWSQMAQKVGDRLVELQSSYTSSISLQKFNLLMFPDWSIDEEILSQELTTAIEQIIAMPENDCAALLLDISSAESTEQVELILAGISMNFLMEQDLDISEHLEILPIGDLSIRQWQVLLPRIDRMIAIPHEANMVKSNLIAAGLQLPNIHC